MSSPEAVRGGIRSHLCCFVQGRWELASRERLSLSASPSLLSRCVVLFRLRRVFLSFVFLFRCFFVLFGVRLNPCFFPRCLYSRKQLMGRLGNEGLHTQNGSDWLRPSSCSAVCFHIALCWSCMCHLPRTHCVLIVLVVCFRCAGTVLCWFCIVLHCSVLLCIGLLGSVLNCAVLYWYWLRYGHRYGCGYG